MLINKKYKKRTYINQISKHNNGQSITIAGWIEDFRDIGKLIFLVIRDVTGTIQVTVTEPLLTQVREIPRQSCLVIEGLKQDSKSKEFQYEIKASEIALVNKANHPLLIDPTGRVESNLDKRLDSRALDLRNPKIKALFMLRSNCLKYIRDILKSNGFIEVNTPKIIGNASEGGANLFRFPYFKNQGYLAQSPQLYKEQLILALDRVFEIGPYFRAENSHTIRHLSEFISVDVEAAFFDYEDAMNLAENTIINVIKELNQNCSDEILTVTGQEKIKEISQIDKLTYVQCIEELNKYDIEMEFGEDLSDSMLRKLGDLHSGFYFISDWPSKLKPFYICDKDEDPLLTESFDLQYGYLELISGGRRHHEQAKLRSKIKEKGLEPKAFEDHLKVFEWGMPPHSGWGLGLDRLMMVLTNTPNVREVVLYPRDTERLSP